MKKHAAQYHDEEDTASVPDTLIRKPRDLHEDRPLFSFTEIRGKRKVADLGPLKELEIATHVASGNSQTTLASSVSRHLAAEGARETPTLPESISNLLEVENAGHFTVRSTSPAVNVYEQRSPFREGSKFAVEGVYSNPSSPRLDLDAKSTQQHELVMPSNFMSPQEALLNFDKAPPFPPIEHRTGSLDVSESSLSENFVDEEFLPYMTLNEYHEANFGPQSSSERIDIKDSKMILDPANPMLFI